MQCVLNATEKELVRNNHMNQINLCNPDIVQDNADLAELAARFDNLDLPSADRRIINDYIACILSRQEKMELLIYYAGRSDALIL